MADSIPHSPSSRPFWVSAALIFTCGVIIETLAEPLHIVSITWLRDAFNPVLLTPMGLYLWLVIPMTLVLVYGQRQATGTTRRAATTLALTMLTIGLSVALSFVIAGTSAGRLIASFAFILAVVAPVVATAAFCLSDRHLGYARAAGFAVMMVCAGITLHTIVGLLVGATV